MIGKQRVQLTTGQVLHTNLRNVLRALRLQTVHSSSVRNYQFVGRNDPQASVDLPLHPEVI